MCQLHARDIRLVDFAVGSVLYNLVAASWRQSTDITLQKGSSQRRRLPDRWKHAITISPMSSAATPKKEAKVHVHHSRRICLLGFVGFKNRAAREIRTQFARAIKLFRTTKPLCCYFWVGDRKWRWHYHELLYTPLGRVKNKHVEIVFFCRDRSSCKLVFVSRWKSYRAGE